MRAPGSAQLRGVIDSGSPISAANAALFGQFGINLDNAQPLYGLGLTVGGQFARAGVFEVKLWLHPPVAGEEPVSWQVPLVARRVWRTPFAILFGQRGWFDRFPIRSTPRRAPSRSGEAGLMSNQISNQHAGIGWT